jgi:hypothetical protein
MSVTFKVVELIDRLHLQSFFMEKDNKVLLNISLDPTKIERFLDHKLKLNGKHYTPNEFELSCIEDLER